MSFLGFDRDFESDSLAVVLEHMARKSNTCIKVLDREGQILAVNQHGIDLLQAERDDLCGKLWSEFWDNPTSIRARQAISTALMGGTDQFVAHCATLPDTPLWDVEIFPLETDADGVKTILVVSVSQPEVTAAPVTLATSIADNLKDVVHSVSNIAAATASGSRLLRGSDDPSRVTMIADHLEDTVARAEETLETLRTLLDQLIPTPGA